jgi:hypothetical protein
VESSQTHARELVQGMRNVFGRIFTIMLVWTSANAIAWVWEGGGPQLEAKPFLYVVGPRAVRSRVRSTPDRHAYRIDSLEPTIGGRAT